MAPAPSPGGCARVTGEPGGPGVRVDSGVDAGSPGARPVRPARGQADRPRRRPARCQAADAARAQRVRDRRDHDAARLPPGTARSSRASSKAQRATASCDIRRSWPSARRSCRAAGDRSRPPWTERRPAAVALTARAGRAPLRGRGARPRTPVRRASRAGAASVLPEAGTPARRTRSSRRCRRRCWPSRSRRATRSQWARSSASSRR